MQGAHRFRCASTTSRAISHDRHAMHGTLQSALSTLMHVLKLSRAVALGGCAMVGLLSKELIASELWALLCLQALRGADVGHRLDYVSALKTAFWIHVKYVH